MARSVTLKQSALGPAAVDLEVELARISAMSIGQLRARWQEVRGHAPPIALSKDLLARALAYWFQEEHLGGLDPKTRKQLAAYVGRGQSPARRVKVGSIIVREYQGKLHEVLVVPDGFCWQGQTFASLSTIARRITGTSWNGPRFFGLRGADKERAVTSSVVTAASSMVPSATKARGSINSRRVPAGRGAAP